MKTFLEESLVEIDERVQKMQADWNGAAASAYDTAHVEWIDSARTAEAGIEKMRAAARSAHDAYTATINANRALFGRGSGSVSVEGHLS
ncbi:WXG100 family type VII secretion target [Nocardia sp. NPDC058518]|uniref:WXG100 family type VII secretion target n=1 Tax=Nocardia sp. NPDC058518 TaxID=3346534 RepID=UPI00366003ED